MDDATQPPARIKEIIDREEIIACLRRYTRGMDRQDREMVRSAYHEDAIDIHGSFVGGLDEFLDWVFRYHADQHLHQHYMTNHTIDLDGDAAHAETYYQFVASYPDPKAKLIIAGGRYIDRLERRMDRWGIVVRICSAEWRSELPMTRSGPSVDSSKLLDAINISRNGADISYLRPLTVRRKTSA
jgi:hypothetical protein